MRLGPGVAMHTLVLSDAPFPVHFDKTVEVMQENRQVEGKKRVPMYWQVDKDTRVPATLARSNARCS